MKVKEYRKAKGYNQSQMAKFLGINQCTYSKKENDLLGFNARELLILEKVLEASISELFYDISKDIEIEFKTE